MKPSTLLFSTLFSAVCLFASKQVANAQVVNGSFEDKTSPYFQPGKNQYSDQYPPYNTFPTVAMFNGWESESRQGGIQYFENSTAGYTGADGSYAIYAGNDGYLESLNPVTTIAANETYTLTLALNLPSGADNSSFQLLATSQETDPNTYSYSTDGGSTRVPAMSPNPLITTLGTLADSGTLSGGSTGSTNFETYSISFDTFGSDNSAYVGDNLSVLINLGAGDSVDNVVVTVPEPRIWALMFVGVAGLLVLGRHKLFA